MEMIRLYVVCGGWCSAGVATHFDRMVEMPKYGGQFYKDCKITQAH